MKIHHALSDLDLVQRYYDITTEPVNLMMSVVYADGNYKRMEAMKRSGVIDSLFLDSGTFTLNKDPGSIAARAPRKYLEYVEIVMRWHQLFDALASYDLDFKDARECADYYEQMILDVDNEDVANKIVPVIHGNNEAADEFADYVDSGAKLIAIGSRPQVPTDQWVRIDGIRAESGIKIHQFGNLGQELLMRVMPDSADSARSVIMAIYGDMLWWNSQTNTLETVSVRNQEFTREHREYIQSIFNIDPSMLLRDGGLRYVVNMYGLNRMQDFLTNVWYPAHEIGEFNA